MHYYWELQFFSYRRIYAPYVYDVLLEYWLFLTSTFHILGLSAAKHYIARKAIVCKKNPAIFHNIHHIYISRVKSLQNSIHARKSTIYVPRMFQTCRTRKYYSSTAINVHSKQKVPSLVSAIICPHISAGHLNCNIWFSPTGNSPRMWCQRHADRLWHTQYEAYLCTEARVWRVQKDPSKG